MAHLPRVVCLGHAIMDRLAHVGAEVVGAAGLEPGVMTLVDGPRAASIAELVPTWQMASGGSAANTAAGIASLGGAATFVGALGRDDLAARYRADLEASGVRCVTGYGPGGLRTGQCLVLVTPDSSRTMATDLGAGVGIDVALVDRAGIESAAVVYIEGYLLDSPPARPALDRVLEVATTTGVAVALSLSDPYVVDRYRDEIAGLVEGPVEVVLANGEEALRLSGARDIEGALAWLGSRSRLAAVTLGASGAVVSASGTRYEIEARTVAAVEDTTGAGDLFAAGLLFGVVGGQPPDAAGRLGALAAGEVVSHLGARPAQSLAALAASVAPL